MTIHLDGAVRFALAALLGGLWQAPLFALAAWLVLRIRPSANATTRHSVLAAALFASLILPVVTAGFALRHVPSSVHGTSEVVVPKGSVPYLPVRGSVSVPVRTPDVDGASAPALSVPAISRLDIAIPRVVALGLAGLWVAGAAFVLLRLIVSLVHLERLKRDALPLSVEYRAQLTRWNAATAGKHDVRLCTSPEIEIPIAVGLFDAMILVPDRLMQELEPRDIDSIVLHELAHLRRGDDWLNALERFAQALLFFNPGVLWLVAQLDLEREVACDDWVLQRNDALPYATCLARVAETTAWPHRAVSAPGAFVTRRGMSIRIERLLSKQRDVRIKTSLGPAGAAVVALGALGAFAALVSPSIAYDAVELPIGPAAAVAPTAPHKPAAPPVRVVSAPKHLTVAQATAPALPAPAPRESALAAPSAPPKSPAHPAYPDVHPGVHVAPDIAPVVRADAHPVVSADAHTMVNPAPQLSALVATGLQYAAAQLQHKAASAMAEARRDESDAERHADAADEKADLVAEANDPDFIDDLASEGYTHLTVDQLIALKSVGVTREFIRGLKREGIAHPDVQDLVKLRTLGVSADFVGSMRRRFGASLGTDDIVGLKAVGVSGAYLDDLASAGLTNLHVAQAQALRAMGVTPDYVRELAHAGYPHLGVEQIQQFRALGINGEFLSRAAAHGFRNLSVDDLFKLKATGVL